MRLIGQGAGVPIEPVEQTTILDSTISLPGVIGGGVPGAGGYDAIWLFIIECDGVSPLHDIEHHWNLSGTGRVTPLLSSHEANGVVLVKDGSRIAGLQGLLKGE